MSLYSDNGGEYQARKSFLVSHGISHLTTLPHTLEHTDFLNIVIAILSKPTLLSLVMPPCLYPFGHMPSPQPPIS